MSLEIPRRYDKHFAHLISLCALSGVGARKFTNLVQVFNVDGDRNVGRITVIKEVFEPDFGRNRADDFAKTRHFEILYAPDIKHQRAERFTDEAHSFVAEIDGIEMM